MHYVTWKLQSSDGYSNLRFRQHFPLFTRVIYYRPTSAVQLFRKAVALEPLIWSKALVTVCTTSKNSWV
jgi:hypothetical protein